MLIRQAELLKYIPLPFLMCFLHELYLVPIVLDYIDFLSNRLLYHTILACLDIILVNDHNCVSLTYLSLEVI